MEEIKSLIVSHIATLEEKSKSCLQEIDAALLTDDFEKINQLVEVSSSILKIIKGLKDQQNNIEYLNSQNETTSEKQYHFKMDQGVEMIDDYRKDVFTMKDVTIPTYKVENFNFDLNKSWPEYKRIFHDMDSADLERFRLRFQFLKRQHKRVELKRVMDALLDERSSLSDEDNIQSTSLERVIDPSHFNVKLKWSDYKHFYTHYPAEEVTKIKLQFQAMKRKEYRRIQRNNFKKLRHEGYDGNKMMEEVEGDEDAYDDEEEENIDEDDPTTISSSIMMPSTTTIVGEVSGLIGGATEGTVTVNPAGVGKDKEYRHKQRHSLTPHNLHVDDDAIATTSTTPSSSLVPSVSSASAAAYASVVHRSLHGLGQGSGSSSSMTSHRIPSFSLPLPPMHGYGLPASCNLPYASLSTGTYNGSNNNPVTAKVTSKIGELKEAANQPPPSPTTTTTTSTSASATRRGL